MTYSLFFFIRDVTGGNLVDWIDRSLAQASLGSAKNRAHRMRHALIEPLRNIYGVSDKVLNMTLADLLLAAPASKPLWRETGFGMIPIDTLVHNFLVRTGLTHRLGAEHTYGSACYSENGCADVIRKIARRIDARQFGDNYPQHFVRFVQHSLWRWCAQSELNVCNGNNIDDDSRCRNANCVLFRRCDRVPLRGQSELPRGTTI
ncbi:MAG: hypothetical protein AB7I42_27660 [Bradyrhizobium sp.]|uniref:hypothetical protein n=1 Tax=Bradyrhizobium sp. TaxID=376 RepID=UPI003D0AA5ED